MIRPLGEGFRHRIAWLLQASVYTLGMVTASSAVGLTVSVVGAMVRQVHVDLPFFAVGLIAIAYGLSEAGLFRLGIPQRRWQVPIEWIARNRYWGSLLYGLCIGLGYLTYVPYPGFYVWQGAALVLGAPRVGLVLGALYGFARAIPSYTTASAACDTEFHQRYTQFIFGNQPKWHRLSAVLLLGIGVFTFVHI